MSELIGEYLQLSYYSTLLLLTVPLQITLYRCLGVGKGERRKRHGVHTFATLWLVEETEDWSFSPSFYKISKKILNSKETSIWDKENGYQLHYAHLLIKKKTTLSKSTALGIALNPFHLYWFLAFRDKTWNKLS